MNYILADVQTEMLRQVAKWGVQHHADGTDDDMFAVIADGLKQANDIAAAQNPEELTWAGILGEEYYEALTEDTDQQKLRDELVQVAAVACSWIRDIDSRNTGVANEDALAVAA